LLNNRGGSAASLERRFEMIETLFLVGCGLYFLVFIIAVISARKEIK
jgi:hypothetical protein